MTWLLAALVALWLARAAVEVRRWYWQRRCEKATGEVERLSSPRSHVRPLIPPFDWDTDSG